MIYNALNDVVYYFLQKYIEFFIKKLLDLLFEIYLKTCMKNKKHVKQYAILSICFPY